MKLRFLVTGAAAVLLAASPALAHEAVELIGYDGKPLTKTSTEPYSPKLTCGECHEYDQITNGYHFQQGRTEASRKVSMSDDFNTKKPWTLSDGMYGKW